MSTADDGSSSTVMRAEPDIGVRPYYVTRGRTRTDRPLGVEVLVETTRRGRQALSRLQFEQRSIAALCLQPISVAEVAARVPVPLGVARLFVGDMSAEGLLETNQLPVARFGDRPDIKLLERVLDGLQAL